ncbi:hypothetical protein SNE40_003758 [Patella caerulea]
MDCTLEFDLGDLDDDGMQEWSEIRDHFVRTDINGDLELSQREMSSDPTGGKLSSSYLKLLDVNEDGKITWADFERLFLELGRRYGNDISLEEKLEMSLSQTESEENGITVKSFVRARSNYLVTDIDDNFKVSEQEFRSIFRMADYDRNGNLTTIEFNGFSPIRNVDVTAYCQNANVGCPVEKFLAMFNDADTDNDKFLTMREYLTKFGKLTTST